MEAKQRRLTGEPGAEAPGARQAGVDMGALVAAGTGSSAVYLGDTRQRPATALPVAPEVPRLSAKLDAWRSTWHP